MSSLIVKVHRPWVTRLFIVLIIAALMLAGWSLFEFGRFHAGYDVIDARMEQESLQTFVMELEARIVELREQNAILKRATQVERKAYADVNTSLKMLQTEILELNEELAFYRGIVSPRDASRGLRLQRYTFVSNGQNRGYRYKVVLTQVLKNDRLARGLVNFVFEGLYNSERKVLALADVTKPVIKQLNYRFKYFQNLEGDILLPDGYEPLRVIIQILPRGRKQDMITSTFNWPVKERESDVGKDEEAKTDSKN